MSTNQEFEHEFLRLLKLNIKTNEKKFKEYDCELRATREKLDEIEELFIKHSKRSLNNSQTLLLLVCGLFVCLLLLAFLGTSIEGQIGTSKIKYSANTVLQIVLTIATAGGGGVAIAQLQRIKK